MKRVAASQDGSPATSGKTHQGLSPSEATALNNTIDEVNMRANYPPIEDIAVPTDDEDLERRQ